MPRNPRFPIFVPSKGRFNSGLTMKALDRIGVNYQLVIQPREREQYAARFDPSKFLLLPDSLDGLVPTRNWIWDYAKERGFPYYWTIDDNIRGFYRLNRNLKVPVADGAIFCAAEDFTERYENLAISGFHYFMFASRKEKNPPLEFNTRVYSNMLIRTDIPFRNRGVYNDDTDLCLRVLKAGWCTVLFMAFLIEKSVTMTVKGGMTPQYQGDGRLKMAQELENYHPDVVKIRRKWGRYQHHVDYRPFKKNKLIRKQGIEIPNKPNEYGMKLVRLDKSE